MFMRFVQLKVKEDSIIDLSSIYERKIIPVLADVKGCVFDRLVQSAGKLDECISLTLWDTSSAADEYVTGGTYNRLLELFSPYLDGTSEWKIRLTEDQKVEYVPVGEEPRVKAYNVTLTPSPRAIVPENFGSLYARILSIRFKANGKAEFKEIYEHEILPALYETPGCRYAYLTEDIGDSDDALSVTVWDSRENAESYEKSGRFESLVRKVSRLPAGLYRWKMSLARDAGRRAVTSEDMTPEGYHVVAGRSFV